MNDEAESAPGGLYRVELQPIGRRAAAATGTTLLEAAQSAGVELQAICGGTGTCGGCRVRLAEGRLSELTPEERRELSVDEIAGGFRLACRARPLGNLKVDIPPESLTGAQRLQVEDGEETPSASASRPSRLGLAIDLGTTKLAVYLVDLDSGRTVRRDAAMNPQIGYGEDLISRIAFTNRSPSGGRVLREKLVDQLNRLISRMCAEAAVSPDLVVEAVAVGNTVMHHLFAGLPVKTLGAAPYCPRTTEALMLSAGDVGLHLPAATPVFLPPLVAGFVGADHVAALLATGVGASPGTSLVIDIGTNTEITVARRGRIFACSSPSGPAFEGAHILAGMRAAPGAIERVRIRGDDVDVYTIGRVPPIGLCGSGILDAVAEITKAGALERRGNFRAGAPGVRSRGRELEFLLVPAERTGHGRDLVVTRGDVNEIQLAKAAIRAGIDVLLDEAGASPQELEDIVLAGAFGSYLDPSSALTIGLFPDVPRSRIRQVGNAAGAGARRMLLSPGARREAGEIAARVEYVELASHAAFHRRFVTAMGFGA